MKRLWVLPLAALLCGSPVNPPRLKPALPESKKSCPASARKLFLLAYAYRQESGEKSRQLLREATSILDRCDEPELRARIQELRSSAL